MWKGFDPRAEPLDVEILQQWEQDDVVLQVLRYRVGIFKGKKSIMAGIYGYPKGKLIYLDYFRFMVADNMPIQMRF